MSIYSKVVVVGESSESPMLEQLEQKLLRSLAQNPRFPLTPDVEFITEYVPQLPAETKEAVEPFVWSLQQRHGKRGGAWQVDFFDPLGFSFMAVYLE
ncbi:MAG TPA: hypothetical protein VJV03_09220 [Pyrinomonadaceae bacterium]|nr:hypothetical protein [Pyrinomonadaceae bacterium]